MRSVQHRETYRKTLLVCFACVIAFFTVYALLLPAITLEKDSSRVLACTVQQHEHDDSCYKDGTLICGKSDIIVHTHEDGCYDSDGNLVCLLQEVREHTHSEECYDSSGKLTCGLDEVILHTHDEECYDEGGNLVCGQLEVTAHQHGDECYISQASTEEQQIAALSEEDVNNSFTMTYDGYTVTFYLIDSASNPIPLPEGVGDIVAKDATRYVFGEAAASAADEIANGKVVDNIAPVIEGYTYTGARSSEANNSPVYSVATKGYADTTTYYRLYSTEPIENRQFYSRDENITVNLTYTKENAELGGKSFAIVNYKSGSTGVAMMEADNSTSSGRRAGQSTAVVKRGTDYYVSSDVTVWTFEKQSDNTYYIYTGDEDNKKYLNINEAAVTVSGNPQAITVTYGNGDYEGRVRLTNSSGQAVNLYGGSAAQGFGGYNDGLNNEWQTLCLVQDGILYDLNISSSYVGSHQIYSSGQWENGEEPEISDTWQDVTAEGVPLFSPANAGEDGYFTYISNKDQLKDISKQMLEDDKSPGKEFRFDGWTYTAGDGTVYTFAAEAEAVLKEDGIHITDTDEFERVIPKGAALTAKWTEISDIVVFYVNYSGTILDTDGDVSGRNQNEFTQAIGIGHVYYGKQQSGNDNVFAGAADAVIRVEFTKEFDPDNENTQIVMDYVTTYENGENNFYNVADGINDYELESRLMAYIRANDGVTIKISTAEQSESGVKNNPSIDTENATTDNYSVRWYVLKEQVDAWHIDGVMVAKTEEIIIKKNFSGLTQEQADEIMEDFKIDVKLGDQDYITMTAQSEGDIGKTINGYYEYLGREASDTNIFKWRFHGILNEKYTFTESGYGLENYDVFKTVVHQYGTGGSDGGVDSASSDTTAALKTNVVGGKSDSVSFTNTYTKSGTGLINIIKTTNADTTDQQTDRLRGAEFTLTDNSTGNIIGTSVSNANGLVFFNNLDPGEYTLKETEAPDGYVNSEKTWTVTVKKETVQDNEKVVVTVGDDLYFDSSTGDMGYLHVANVPAATTIQIKKTFKGLSDKEIADLVDSGNDSDSYMITVKNENNETKAKLSLLNVNIYSTEESAFVWYVTDIDPGKYTVTESGYLLDDYIDTVINADINGTAVDKENITVNRDENFASFTFDKSTNDMDTIALTNTYLNTFTLKLKKVDENKGTALQGAVFDIYGGYRDATDTSKSIKYKDPETGSTATAYYIGQIQSDDEGIASMTGLHLSDSNNTFVYVYNESQSPDNYAPLDEPIVSRVTIGNERYEDGVYSVPVANTLKSDSKTSVTVTKKWAEDFEGAESVTVELYRKAEGATAAERVSIDDPVVLNERNNWSYTWKDLDGYNNDGELYTYYVYEQPVNGYLASYSNEENISVGGQTLEVGTAEGTVTDKTVTITNRSGYELPDTGGPGDFVYIMAGLLMTCGVLTLYIRRRRSKGGGSSLD